MDSITTEGDLPYFLDDPQNARKLNGLVDGVRYALVDYQVRDPKDPLSTRLTLASDFVATRHLRRELSIDRESHPLQPGLV